MKIVFVWKFFVILFKSTISRTCVPVRGVVPRVTGSAFAPPTFGENYFYQGKKNKRGESQKRTIFKLDNIKSRCTTNTAYYTTPLVSTSLITYCHELMCVNDERHRPLDHIVITVEVHTVCCLNPMHNIKKTKTSHTHIKKKLSVFSCLLGRVAWECCVI